VPSITATNDGRAINYETTSWADTRKAASANSVNSSSALPNAIVAQKAAGRGGTTYGISRTFMQFDTSSISTTPESAILHIYGYDDSDLEVIIMKALPYSTLDITDFNNISAAVIALNNSDGSGGGALGGLNGKEYSTVEDGISWSVGSWNIISLNSDALSDMTSGSLFEICVMGYTYDYLDIEPSGTLRSGLYSSAESGKEPYIRYVVAVTDNATFFGANF
jgi:hypothetical protein|tara:strand:- start:214 stop:879 length:666 start_codon:yes stop_codon:yes gene_type:complete